MKPLHKSPGYIIRNPYSYCFRMKVPIDIQGWVGKKELRYSLKTGYIGEAKEKARYLAGKVQYLFRLLRKGGILLSKLTDEKIQEMVQEYLDWNKKSIEEWYEDPEESPFEDREHYYDHLSMLDELIKENIEFLALGNYKSIEGLVSKKLLDHDIHDVEKGSKEYIKLCRSMLQGSIKNNEYEKLFLQNEIPEEPDLPRQSEPVPVPPEETSEPLNKVVTDYWNERESTWKERTKPEIRRALDHMIDFVGKNTEIHKIDVKLMREYKQHLRTEKTRSGKTRTIKTINDKYLCFTKALFKFAKSNGYTKENPAEGMLIKDRKKKRPHEEQDPFSTDDLRMLFCDSKEYKEDKHRKNCNFWIPLIGLYTGMREEEISQLYVSDLKKIDGLWCLDIKEEDYKPDKSVKMSEKRIVPLHPFLVDDLNFVGYVQNLPDIDGRIFPKMKRVDNRYSHGFCQWFRKFKIRCGVDPTPRKKTFHSFRHTVIDNLMQKEIPERVVSMLVGHAIPGQTSGRYAKPFKPKRLMERTVLQLDYGIDLSYLKDSKFVVTG